LSGKFYERRDLAKARELVTHFEGKLACCDGKALQIICSHCETLIYIKGDHMLPLVPVWQPKGFKIL